MHIHKSHNEAVYTHKFSRFIKQYNRNSLHKSEHAEINDQLISSHFITAAPLMDESLLSISK